MTAQNAQLHAGVTRQVQEGVAECAMRADNVVNFDSCDDGSVLSTTCCMLCACVALDKVCWMWAFNS